jgi:EmrB/QacA subfamily drug resistance transporter
MSTHPIDDAVAPTAPGTAPAPAAPTPAADGSTLPTRRLWLILGAVLTADALDLMDSTLTNIAAPSIAASLGGGEVLIKWLGAAYALALGTLLVLGGRLGDRYGQRRTFLVGMAGFTLASALCGLAWTGPVLIVARLLQGAFGALLIPQGIAIMTSTFPREFMAKAFAFFGPMLGVASVGGPLLGAYLVSANLFGFGWRPMFLINIIIGALGLALAWRVLPRTSGDRTVVLDGWASGLLAGAMSCLVYGLIDGPTSNWSPLSIGFVVAGVVLLAAFAVRQRTGSNPLIRASLFRNRGFSAGLVMGLVFFSVVTGMVYVVSLFLQQGLGRTAVQTATTAMLPMSVGIIIAAGSATPLMAKLGRRLLLIGLGLTLVGVAWAWIVVGAQGIGMGTWALAGPMLAAGMGMGTCFGTLFDIALGDIDPEEGGSASGALSAVQQLAGAIGSAVITSVWFARIADAPSAMRTCLVIVAAVTVVCGGLVFLLPKHARPDAGH